MSKIMLVFLAALAVFFLACAGSPASANNSSSSRDAEAAAAAALASMDRAFSGEPVTAPSPSPVTAPTPPPAQQAQVPVNNSSTQPAWVNAPNSVYSDQRYVSAVGYGTNRFNAEQSAFTNLTGVFGQSIQSQLNTMTNYNEAVRNGVIQTSGNTNLQEAINISIQMDSLMGAQIADVWVDSRNTYYAVAVMDRSQAATLYAELIRSNERNIDTLVNMTPEEKNTIYGYSRYLRAATIADANRVYANVLIFLGNTSGINTANMKNGEDYRIEASAIARNIPIGVSIEGDRLNRLASAFSRSLSGLGFRTGGNNSRYVLNAEFTMTVQPTQPGQTAIYVRGILVVNLTDITDNSVSYYKTYDRREGHISQQQAEDRVISWMEDTINSEFGTDFRDYLSSQLR